MKFLALLYVLVLAISVTNAGFFTPSPKKNQQQQHIYSKDDDVHAGGAVIDENDISGNIKISVSPNEHEHVHEGKVLEEAKDKVKEAASRIHDQVKDAFGAKETAQDVSIKAKHKAKEKVHEGVEAAGQKLVGRAREGQKGLFNVVVSGLLLHLLGFAVAYGTCVWVTFASTRVMVGALPGLQLAMVQSKMYPLYFKAMAASVGISLLGYLMTSTQIRRPTGIFNLIASLAMVLVNMIYLEPHTTKMMFERMKKEKEEPEPEPEPEPAESLQGEAKTKEATPSTSRMSLRSPHVYMGLNSSKTSLLNVATLVSLTWHLLQLSQQLHPVC